VCCRARAVCIYLELHIALLYPGKHASVLMCQYKHLSSEKSRKTKKRKSARAEQNTPKKKRVLKSNSCAHMCEIMTRVRHVSVCMKQQNRYNTHEKRQSILIIIYINVHTCTSTYIHIIVQNKFSRGADSKHSQDMHNKFMYMYIYTYIHTHTHTVLNA
jgi:hypothetical protein